MAGKRCSFAIFGRCALLAFRLSERKSRLAGYKANRIAVAQVGEGYFRFLRGHSTPDALTQAR